MPSSAGSGWTSGQPGVHLDLHDDTPVFVISVAAQLAGMHPQTLRQYDRLGLVSPDRTRGRGRRYSARNIATLREVQRLSQDEGISLAGIKAILALEREVVTLHERVRELTVELERARSVAGLHRRVFAAGPGGEVVSVLPGRRPSRPVFGGAGELVIWSPRN